MNVSSPRMFRLPLRRCTRKYQKLQTTLPPQAYLHISVKREAVAATKTRIASPKVRLHESSRKDSAFSNAPNWPVDVLRVACQSGAVKASLPRVYEFLNSVWSLVKDKKFSKSNVEALLNKYELSAEDLTMIARCLISQRSDRILVSIGLDCISLAADIGDNNAALYLVDLAVENKAEKSIGPLRYQKALSHIRNLAASKDLPSMVLLAKTYEQSGEYREASSIYKKVVEREANHVQQGQSILENERSSYAEAYRNLGRLLSRNPGSDDAALQYFERAALEYEDAMSFYYLALMHGESHKDYITFMSQAAISGVTEATYELGLVYAKAGDAARSSGSQANTQYLMAIHWFDLAQESVKLATQAKLHIARIQKIQNNSSRHSDNAFNDVMEKLNVVLSPKLHRFLDDRWKDAAFSLDAATLESKIEELQ